MLDSIQKHIADLNTPNPSRQALAAEALAAMGEGAQPAIVALVQVCGSSDEAVRNWCAAALEDVGAPEPAQIADLELLAKSTNSDVAFWAVTLLGRAVEMAAQAIPTLIDRLRDRSAPQVQRRAAWALGQIDSHSTDAINALGVAAADDNTPLATAARQALKKIKAA